MSVFDLRAGESAKISSVDLCGAEAKRLFSLGVKKGVRVTVLAFSLFKSAALLSVPPVRVALRKNIALKISVERCA